MKKVQVAEGIHWVGAIDWDIRDFHGYSTHRGTSYNAFLIVDDKVAIIDTVKAPFFPQMLQRIKEIIDPNKIDYVISNHVEMDHSGSLPMILKEACNAQLVTGAKHGEAGLRKHFGLECPMITVKEGDEIDLGKRKLTFLPTPMLHWPDSMVTYSPQDEILFSSDAFGQHLASSGRFDDEVESTVIMQEATKYYANILMPLGNLIPPVAEKLGNLNIKIIAPDHGVIWRLDPGKIVKAYVDWSSGKTKKKALVIYDTMWQSTTKMAEAIGEGLMSKGVEVKMYRLTGSDKSDIVSHVLDSKAIVMGSPTLNNGMFPSLAEFLCYMKGLKPKGKVGAVFGSYGWSGGATKAMRQEMEQAGIAMIESDLAVKWIPDQSEITQCYEYGQQIADKIS
ncbi:MAG: FprA family A-type flavoprotein [Chloroflexota bacterium]|nr:FprA family A-type flavoprotein [Chloroflexota bacterium]